MHIAMTSLFRNFFFDTRWGEYSLISLYISVLSGVLVGLQFQYDTPLFSSITLELLIPYGSYFRSLHFYSSQLFFLLSIVHMIATFRHSDVYQDAMWVKYILSFPIVLLLLFTGYVLRGDTTGSSAGMIAENILLAIPLIGKVINYLLFSITDHGMSRVYINHVIGLDVLWLFFLWQHLRRFRVTFSTNLSITSATLLFCLLFTAPLEIAKPGEYYITGPWFFIGLQELLRFLPIFFAGLVFPGSLIFALFFLRRQKQYYPQLLIFIATWFAAYFFLTMAGLLRS